MGLLKLLAEHNDKLYHAVHNMNTEDLADFLEESIILIDDFMGDDVKIPNIIKLSIKSMSTDNGMIPPRRGIMSN